MLVLVPLLHHMIHQFPIRDIRVIRGEILPFPLGATGSTDLFTEIIRNIRGKTLRFLKINLDNYFHSPLNPMEL